MRNLFLVNLAILLFFRTEFLSAQNLISNNIQLQEYLRREQLSNGLDSSNASFNYRPFSTKKLEDFNFELINNKQSKGHKQVQIFVLPIFQTLQYNSKRPYGWGDGPMIPSVGLQSYTSAGIFSKISFLKIQLQPELVLAQDLSFEGFGLNRSEREIREMFFTYNISDIPERFGTEGYGRFFLGQSKISLEAGSFEAGLSTQNIWWGPGQFNSLIFSNNAQGFPHLTFNTIKPAKTFLGNFEGQIIVGRLENSGIAPTQFPELNDRFFIPFTGDWRYLNGLTFSYNPKWIPGLFFGFSRTYQQYSEFMGDQWNDFLPIFEPFQKINYGFDRDTDGRDQQFSVFTRFVSTDAKAELYFEYGRRDHALNWREFILNPEHARAYLFGFIKLFELQSKERHVQVRGEVTHQQESINTIIRNSGDGQSWHTHSRARGFVHYGQPLGVGIGTGSNVQTLEVSIVEKFNKIGVLFERLENHQDFYYRAFGQQNEHRPWIDLSVGFLFDKQFDNLLLSSRVQLINGVNYQWQLHPDSTPEFPRGQNLFSIHSQVSLIYLFTKNKYLKSAGF